MIKTDDHRRKRYRVKLDRGADLTRKASDLVPIDPIRQLTGDPPPGRSALDQLRAKQEKKNSK